MYTLEDDQETSARLRKQAVTRALQTSSDEEMPGAAAHGGPQTLALPGLAQLSGAFKRITTPDQTRQQGRPTLALAALTIACVAVFFTALDQTVVVTALPQIVTDLQIPITQIDHASWIVSAYLLGFVIMMPLMGRVSDLYGRRRIFLLCLAIFGAGSIFCGLAPLLGQTWDLGFLGALGIDTSTQGQVGLIWLIVARFFQAIGGGALVPVAMAIASDFYGDERRGLALGLIGAVTEAGGAIGPLYGALIVEHLGWQAIFYLNVPIVLVLTVCAWFLVPRGTRLRETIDWPGTGLLGLALACLSLGLAQQGAELGPSATQATAQNNPIALALALVFLLAFVFVERKMRHPLIDLALFKRLSFSATSLVSLLIGAALIIALADIPIFVDTVLQRPVIDSGLALLRMTAMIPIGALLGGWLCGQISCRLTAVLGLLFTAAGFYLMSRWPLDVGWTQITISTLTAGLGFGLVIAPIGTTALNAVRTTQTGMSAALVTALRMVGMMLGLAALTSWALAYFKALAATYPSLPATASAAQFAQWSKGYAQHLISAAHTVYSAVFFAAMLLSLVAVLPALFLWGRRPAAGSSAAETSSAATLAASTAGTVDPEALTLPAGLEPPGPPVTTPPPPQGPRRPSRLRWPPRRRTLLLAGLSLLLALLLAGGLLATCAGPRNGGQGTDPSSATATASAGPHIVQLALSGPVLGTLFTQQLGEQKTITDLKIRLLPASGLVLNLNLHIDMNGIHRTMPVELDTVMRLDSQQNIQLQVLHLKRDGRDAGPGPAATMQSALNHLLQATLMPMLHRQLKGVRLLALSTSNSTGCGSGEMMAVLKLLVPAPQGSSATGQTPTSTRTLCLNDTATLKQFLGTGQ
jgi:MFS family permease